VTLAERVEQQTGIPYLLFDGSLAETPRLLRAVGRAVGASEAAEMLARDAERQLREVMERVGRVKERWARPTSSSPAIRPLRPR